MRWCRTCLMPSTRPRVVFDETGQCNACKFHVEYAKTDWQARKAEFLDLVRSMKRHPVYDLIVPFSGGKDSASIAWRCKYELGLNPLLVTFGQLMWTSEGRRNWHRVRDAGFDIVYIGVNQKVCRSLTKRFLTERGHPKNHYDAAVNSVPLIEAVTRQIPLVCYAEFGEAFYGGHVLSQNHYRQRDLAEVLENQVGDDPRNWAVDGISEADLYPYVMPEQSASVMAVYWSYFFKWDIFENAQLARRRMRFEVVEERPFSPLGEHIEEEVWGRSDGTFEGFDSIDDKIDGLDFFLMHVKFGFGRAARMASRLIQQGHMTRERALPLVRQFDGEFPEMYMQDVLDYVGMNRDELLALADRHRNPEIWKEENGSWKLRHPPV